MCLDVSLQRACEPCYIDQSFWIVIFFSSCHEIWLPGHDYWVITSWGKVISTRAELDGWGRAFMPVEGEQDSSHSDVPDFDGWVIWGTEQVLAIGVEADLVDLLVMGVVVLKKAFRSEIPEFNFCVDWAWGNTGSIRVEDDGPDCVEMVSEAVDFFSLGKIPEFYSSIIRGRDYYTRVRRELSASDPVRMGCNWCFEVMDKLVSSFMHPFW